MESEPSEKLEDKTLISDYVELIEIHATGTYKTFNKNAAPRITEVPINKDQCQPVTEINEVPCTPPANSVGGQSLKELLGHLQVDLDELKVTWQGKRLAGLNERATIFLDELVKAAGSVVEYEHLLSQMTGGKYSGSGAPKECEEARKSVNALMKKYDLPLKVKARSGEGYHLIKYVEEMEGQ